MNRIHIPIQSLTTAESINLLTCEERFILPKQITTLPVYSLENVPNSFSLIIDHDSTLINENNLKIIPTLAEKTKNDIYQVFVKNNQHTFKRLFSVKCD